MNIDETKKNIEHIKNLLKRSLDLLSKRGMPEDMNKAIAQMRRFIEICAELRTELHRMSKEMRSFPL